MNTFSDPQKIIDQLEIFPGQQVADLGAGSGAYSLAMAEKLKGNPDSRVFAIDIQKELLSRIDALAESKKLSSVHIIWGNIEQEKGTCLRGDSLDKVLIANTLFQVEHKKNVIKEAYRILQPGGQLIIIDWSESFGNIGPKPDHIISQETAQLLCKEIGFTASETIQAGEHHYGFIATKGIVN